MIAPDIYTRARAAGIPACQAILIARHDPAALDWHPNRRGDMTADLPDVDGFTLRAVSTADECGTLEDLGYGRFLDSEEHWRTGYHVRPHPDAIPNPHRDSRNPSGGALWYVPAVTIRESAAWFRKSGEARGPAWEHARAMAEDELSRATDDYGPDVRVVTVTAYRAGVELASASVGGIEIAWDPIRRTSGDSYLDEVARDIAPEVIDEARATLARLVAA
jgi:hypothetical protein